MPWLSVAVFLPLVGVVVQAVLGGITVLTHLNPATVAAHFLVSMGLVCASTYLLWRAGEPDGPAAPVVRAELVWLARALAAVTVVVLLLGTLVTGSGPHSGDADAPARFGLDPRAMSWLHSDAVLVWFGLLGMLLIALRLTAAGRRPRREAWVTLGVGLAQGVIGYLQYFNHLPAGLVWVHVATAVTIWIFVLQLYLSTGTGLPRSAKRAAPGDERPAGESAAASPPVKTTIL